MKREKKQKTINFAIFKLGSGKIFVDIVYTLEIKWEINNMVTFLNDYTFCNFLFQTKI